ncbi:hypothetical protein [Polyangium sp. 6x1]|uniref:hypothetical protein n=1 Tax=Polyangium sp. 6x1 TaxID=3042689 RepID=UPI002482688E|nr:hypothetical protein [Polyangium sp. 6x1]MDI1450215.1 hypothetical protein [Polyangium sp. 6x1]
MHMHDSTAYRLALAFMLTTTAFGCGSEGDAVDAVAETSAALEPQAQPEGHDCCPQGDAWSEPVAPDVGDEVYDHNDDGLICFKFIGGQGGNSVPAPGFTIKDNNNPCEEAP